MDSLKWNSPLGPVTKQTELIDKNLFKKKKKDSKATEI
jgi:hypothetical protein